MSWGKYMTSFGFRMLLVQGYKKDDIINNSDIGMLARWTPFTCGLFGLLGYLLKSPTYLCLLGLLTLVGALSNRSIYDYCYQFLIRPILHLRNMPYHGIPRRFGCAIGAILFLLSGIGFQLHYLMLAAISIFIIVSLAFIAAFTQWCFASAIYRLISGRDADCC
jgi:hypothetical protein